jgi:hypothetical protein
LTRYINHVAFLALLLIVVGVVFFWPSSHHYIGNRQQQAALEFYQQNLTEGMTREQVQVFVDSHQSQQLNTLFVQHPLDGTISIPLGEISGPWYCSREVAYLQFNFNAMQRDAHGHPTLTAIDNFSRVQLLNERQDCL